MPALTKAAVAHQIAPAEKRGYDKGFSEGRKAEAELRRNKILEAQTELMKAVGQTINGLAQALDCGPRT